MLLRVRFWLHCEQNTFGTLKKPVCQRVSNHFAPLRSAWSYTVHTQYSWLILIFSESLISKMLAPLLNTRRFMVIWLIDIMLWNLKGYSGRLICGLIQGLLKNSNIIIKYSLIDWTLLRSLQFIKICIVLLVHFFLYNFFHIITHKVFHDVLILW